MCFVAQHFVKPLDGIDFPFVVALRIVVELHHDASTHPSHCERILSMVWRTATSDLGAGAMGLSDIGLAAIRTGISNNRLRMARHWLLGGYERATGPPAFRVHFLGRSRRRRRASPGWRYEWPLSSGQRKPSPLIASGTSRTKRLSAKGVLQDWARERVDPKTDRGTNMDVAYISAMSALAGSVIGGMTSGITTWLNQRAQLRSNQIAQDQSKREELYKEFILAASNAYGEAIMTNEPHIPEIIALYAMVSRMRAFSLPRTVACAEQVMLVTIETYALPNKSIPELSELMKNGTSVDPLKDFAEAVRAELGRRMRG